METKEKNVGKNEERKARVNKMSLLLKPALIMGFIFGFLFFLPHTTLAHCDSYDGPVIKDAYKALESNNVNLVLKWIAPDQEQEIISLFNKTYNLKTGDNEIYQIVEKHFLETLVRLHRETEGAPYTGLKPAGTTKMIVVLSDKAVETQSVDDLVGKLNAHIEKVVREKFNLVASLYGVKDESVEKGREYVDAYVDYTHTLEAIHDILEHGGGHSAH
ncbi:MAG: hypothetical protein K0B09_07710 [Bacteroidales bacterium]|nr:hypothetical protein [Bacteroidales bacterium]